MKSIIAKTIAIAFVTVLCAQASAKAITFNRNANSLISFQLVNLTSAKITIRDNQGNIVRTMNVYGKICNLETTSLLSGNYSYTITGSNGSSEGSFSVK